MSTAQDFRDQLTSLKARVADTTASLVRQGHVTGTTASTFLTGLGLAPVEDAETRAAREELEAFQARVRDAVAAQETDNYRRSQALIRFGL